MILNLANAGTVREDAPSLSIELEYILVLLLSLNTVGQCSYKTCKAKLLALETMSWTLYQQGAVSAVSTLEVRGVWPVHWMHALPVKYTLMYSFCVPHSLSSWKMSEIISFYFNFCFLSADVFSAECHGSGCLCRGSGFCGPPLSTADKIYLWYCSGVLPVQTGHRRPPQQDLRLPGCHWLQQCHQHAQPLPDSADGAQPACSTGVSAGVLRYVETQIPGLLCGCSVLPFSYRVPATESVGSVFRQGL